MEDAVEVARIIVANAGKASHTEVLLARHVLALASMLKQG